jgi:hypothetical protein
MPAKNLSDTPKGCTREQIKIDDRGTIFVTWDEGWDRLSEAGAPEKGVLIYSDNKGATWSDPIEFTYPEHTNVQLTAASDGQGTVLAVWRATTQDTLFYSWSTDNARTWSQPEEIPGILARQWEWTRFDAYDMAVDSAGVMHLVVVGRESIKEDSESDGVYHLAWDGHTWSAPERIFGDRVLHAEYPKITISRGNEMHVTWFTRDQEFTDNGYYQIWYSSSQSAAPLLPLPTPLAPTEEAAPTQPLSVRPTRTPIPPEISSTSLVLDAQSLTTENDDVLRLLISLLPVLVITGAVIGIALYRRSQH